jgi:hypothetical protein
LTIFIIYYIFEIIDWYNYLRFIEGNGVMNNKIFGIFLAISFFLAMESHSITQEEHEAIERSLGYLQKRREQDLSEKIRGYHNVPNTQPPLTINSYFSTQHRAIFVKYLEHLYSALQENKEVKDGVLELKSLERVFLKRLGQDVKKQNIVPHKLELCFCAASFLALGCVGGWLAHSHLTT